MSIFNNEILAWLKYFAENTPIDLSTVRILDITGEDRNLLPAVQANRSVLVFTDGNRPEVFYSMWDSGMGDCEIWYNEGSEPAGPMKHNLLSEMIDRGSTSRRPCSSTTPHTGYRIGLDNSSFSPGTIRYVAPEIRAVILKKLNLDEGENICCVSGESIAVERHRHRRPPGQRGGRGVQGRGPADHGRERGPLRAEQRADCRRYGELLPPLAGARCGLPGGFGQLDLELKTLVHVNPKIRVVIYTLEFSIMSRIPGMLWENGIEPTEIMQLEVSKVGRKDEIEVQPAPWDLPGASLAGSERQKPRQSPKTGGFAA